MVVNTDVKYLLNIDAISAGLEAMRVGVDTPSPTPIDMVSGKLDSLLLSLNTRDQNLFGLLQRSESRDLKKLVRLSLIIIFTFSRFDIEDPRTWKSVCLKCNMPRNLLEPISCCY